MKVLALLSIILASSFAKAEERVKDIVDPSYEYVHRKLGPRFLEETITFNREYNEDGEPPAGRQVAISIEHPAEEPDNEGETLTHPGSRALEEFKRRTLADRRLGKKKKSKNMMKKSNNNNNKKHYNCYSYCWWHSYYGWITYCCPYWGCGYYYC